MLLIIKRTINPNSLWQQCLKWKHSNISIQCHTIFIYLHIRILLEVVYLAIHIYFQLHNCGHSFKIIPKIRIFFIKFPYKVYITSIYLLIWVSIRVYLSIYLSTYVSISFLIHLCIYNIFLWYLSISLFSIIRISLPILCSLL